MRRCSRFFGGAWIGHASLVPRSAPLAARTQGTCCCSARAHRGGHSQHTQIGVWSQARGWVPFTIGAGGPVVVGSGSEYPVARTGAGGPGGQGRVVEEAGVGDGFGGRRVGVEGEVELFGSPGGGRVMGGREKGGEEGGAPPLLREGQSHSGRSVVSPVGRVVLRRGLLGGQGRGLLAARREALGTGESVGSPQCFSARRSARRVRPGLP